jgi:general secretion pathway protein K
MSGDRGIALLNALILVAAIAALAAGLMLRATASLERAQDLQISQQAALHLDAAALLLDSVLRDDWRRAPEIDHGGEPWARQPIEAEIDRGTLTGQLSDLQGRFNVNSLANATDTAAARAFDRLLRRLGLPAALGPEIAGFVQPRGPVRAADYLDRPVPIRLGAGAVDRVEALRLVRGMTEGHYARLAPYVAALAPGTPLNVNTALPEVLGAVLPAASPADIARLVDERARAPFASTSDFTTRAERLIHARVIAQAEAPAGGFGVRTNWFEARFDLALDGRVQSRILIVQRTPPDGVVHVTQRRMILP